MSPVSQARPSSSLARTRTLRVVFSLAVLSPVGCAACGRGGLLSPLCQRGEGGSLGVELCDGGLTPCHIRIILRVVCGCTEAPARITDTCRALVPYLVGCSGCSARAEANFAALPRKEVAILVGLTGNVAVPLKPSIRPGAFGVSMVDTSVAFSKGLSIQHGCGAVCVTTV